MEMYKNGWMYIFSNLKALWIHDGNPKRPHALLTPTSGKHSNGFFNASKVIEHPDILTNACSDTINMLDEHIKPTIVIGSALGAISIAHATGNILKARCGFTEPVVIDGEKQMALKRFSVGRDDRVLVVEDVMTTGGTTRKTIATIEGYGAEVFPEICVLVNRSGMKSLDGRKIVALVDYPMPIWEPDECPLCKVGSEPIRPKNNWDELIAGYKEE